MILELKRRTINLLSIIRPKAQINESVSVSEDNEDLLNYIKNNIRFKDVHKGERCFILGNGPSLKKQDLTCLKGEILFTVNQFMRADYAKELHSSYHFWADPSFFSDNEVNSSEILDLMLSAKSNTVTFFISDGFNFVKEKKIDKKINCSFYKTSRSILDDVLYDFETFVSNCATVVQYAVLLAIYMGFSEIYLRYYIYIFNQF